MIENKMIVGNSEYCSLPTLAISNIEVRVDTGAQTSSLHAEQIEVLQRGDERWVRFLFEDANPPIYCEAKVVAKRKVKSSNGTKQSRYVIESELQLGGSTWPIQLTLTDRSDMSYVMLLGREGMGDRLLVDPSAEFLLRKA